MKYIIFYHVPDKKYDYTSFESWDEAMDFMQKCKDNVDSGMSFEIKTGVE